MYISQLILQVLVQSSAVLFEDISFSTLHDSLTHCIALVQSSSPSSPPSPSSSPSHCINLLDEVCCLLEPRGVASGCGLMVHAIADIIELIVKAKKEMKSNQSVNNKGTCNTQ